MDKSENALKRLHSITAYPRLKKTVSHEPQALVQSTQVQGQQADVHKKLLQAIKDAALKILIYTLPLLSQ